MDKRFKGAHQFSFNDANEDGEVAVHHLFALCTQTFIRDELAGLLQVPENLSLQTQKEKKRVRLPKLNGRQYILLIK